MSTAQGHNSGKTWTVCFYGSRNILWLVLDKIHVVLWWEMGFTNWILWTHRVIVLVLQLKVRLISVSNSSINLKCKRHNLLDLNNIFLPLNLYNWMKYVYNLLKLHYGLFINLVTLYEAISLGFQSSSINQHKNWNENQMIKLTRKLTLKKEKKTSWFAIKVWNYISGYVGTVRTCGRSYFLCTEVKINSLINIALDCANLQ